MYFPQVQLPFQRIEVSRQQALDIFYDNKLKVTVGACICFLKVDVCSLCFVYSILQYRFNYIFVLDNSNQVEIISALPEDKNITLYRCDSFVEICPGPLIPNASFVKAFGCLKVCVPCIYACYSCSFVLIHLNCLHVWVCIFKFKFAIPGFFSQLEE